MKNTLLYIFLFIALAVTFYYVHTHEKAVLYVTYGLFGSMVITICYLIFVILTEKKDKNG